jgi:hypothetical protein
MSEDDENRQQAEEDAKEDLELRDEDADKIAGGGGGEFDQSRGMKY